jgi:hypothetical protein
MSRHVNILLLALILPLGGTTQAATSTRLHIVNARVAEAPPVLGMNAGYFEIDNGTSAPVTLTQVSSTDFARIELHRTIIKNGMARMMPAGSVTIAAQSRLEFAPGGYHLMLFHPARPLRAGDTVRLAFHFADESTIEVNAKIVKISN